MPPRPVQPTKVNQKEQKAIDQANAVKDNVPEEVKKTARMEARQLAAQINEEEKNLAFYQQEREKLNVDWIVTKKELEDLKGEVINKEREVEDLKENHIMTINLYKQRVKHMLFQNQDQQAELKKDVEITLKQNEDDHRIKERELKTDNRYLRTNLKEQELSHLDYNFALNAEWDKKMTLQRQEYERQFIEVKKKYDLKMQKMRSEMEEARAQLIRQAEDKKDAIIAQLTRDHVKKYMDIKAYYMDITTNNIATIKKLKNEIAGYQKQEDKYKIKLQQIEKESRELTEPLKNINEEIQQLLIQTKEHDKVKKQKDEINVQREQCELLLRKQEYEYEVKLQQYNFLKRDKDYLYNKFNTQIQKIQQKIGLKNLIMEKQIQAIQENIEIKDLELNKVLQSLNIDQEQLGTMFMLEGITKPLEEVKEVKNQLIQELESQLLQIRKAHSHMVKAYEGKLSEYVIPVEELGFDPLVPNNVD